MELYEFECCCDECDKKLPPSQCVEFCEDADYEEPRAIICKECLERALVLIKERP